jgi:hypothetical protein
VYVCVMCRHISIHTHTHTCTELAARMAGSVREKYTEGVLMKQTFLALDWSVVYCSVVYCSVV